jgi:hypothetical protein
MTTMDVHNDGRTVEIMYVDSVERDQDDPYGPFEWDAQRQRWYTLRRADVAQTTHHTLRGRFTERWYRRLPYGFDNRRPVWRSASGGTPAPSHIVAALNAALHLAV